MFFALCWGVDGLVMNVPFFGCAAACVAAVVSGVVLLVRRRKNPKGGRVFVVMAAGALLCIAASVATTRCNRVMGKRGAERIVGAVERFRGEHDGVWPASLDELVPKYMDAIPRSRIGVMSGYRYFVYEGRATLMWVEIPPFGRRTYDFVEKRWSYID